MRIVIEGNEELLEKLEKIQKLARELYREVSGVLPLTETKYIEEVEHEEE